MGNREDLLAGARECLLDKGYLQTTARDIAQASGVSLAAIGYHFGTKEALLQQAMMEMNAEWMQRILEFVASRTPTDGPDIEQFRDMFALMIKSSEFDKRLLQVSVETLLNVDPSAMVVPHLEAGMKCAQDSLLTCLGFDAINLDENDRQRLGATLHAMMMGVRVMHAIKPHAAPGADDLAMAMCILAGAYANCDLDTLRTSEEPAAAPSD